MAARRNLGALYVSMGANTTDFRSKMAGARQDINRTKNSFTAFKAAAVGALAALAGGTAIRAVRTLNSTTKELAEYGALIDRRAKALNVSTEELQYHQRALDALGGGEEVFTKAIEKSTKAFYDYAAGLDTIKDAFRVLGIEQEDIKKVAGSTTAQFELLLAKIAEVQKVNFPAAQAAALNVFGARNARNITPFAENYQTEIARAREQGGALGTGTAASLDRLNHEMDVFNQKIKNMKAEFVADNADDLLEIQTQWHEALVKLFPILKDVAKWTAEWVGSFADWYGSRENQLAERGYAAGERGQILGRQWFKTEDEYEKHLDQWEQRIMRAENRNKIAEAGAGAGPRPKPEYLWGDSGYLEQTPESRRAIQEWNAVREGLISAAMEAGKEIYNVLKPRGEKTKRQTEDDLADTINADTLNAALAKHRADARMDLVNLAAGMAKIQQGAGISEARRLELEDAGAGAIASARTREALNDLFRSAIEPLRGQRDRLQARHGAFLDLGDTEGASKTLDELEKVKERIAAIRMEWEGAKKEIFPGIAMESRKAAEEEYELIEAYEARMAALESRAELIADISGQLAGGLHIVFDTLTGKIEDTEEAVKSLGRALVHSLKQKLLVDPLASGIEGFISAGIKGFAGGVGGGGTPNGFSPGADRLHAAGAGSGKTVAVENIIFNGVEGAGVRAALRAEVPGIVSTATDHIQNLSQNPASALARITRRK